MEIVEKSRKHLGREQIIALLFRAHCLRFKFEVRCASDITPLTRQIQSWHLHIKVQKRMWDKTKNIKVACYGTRTSRLFARASSITIDFLRKGIVTLSSAVFHRHVIDQYQTQCSYWKIHLIPTRWVKTMWPRFRKGMR